MRLQLLDIAALVTVAVCGALETPVFNSSGIFNDHYEDALARIIRTGRTPNTSAPLPAKRAIIESLKPQIQKNRGSESLPRAISPPFRTTGQDSVGPTARTKARRMGGTTLEDNVESFMPGFAYAMAASGVVYVIRGEMTRPNNVFDTQVRVLGGVTVLYAWTTAERLPILQANPAVTAVYQINAHLVGSIWPPNPGPMLTQTAATTAVATAYCYFSRVGLWQHSQSSVSPKTRVSSPYGYYYGGQSSTTTPGAFTYSYTPQSTTTRVTQLELSTWITGAPSFDAHFPTSSAWQPTAINYGQGWIPHDIACLMGNDIDRMGGLKIRGLPLGDSITYGFQSTDGKGYRLVLQDLIDNPPWVTNPDPSRKRQSGDRSIVEYIGSVDSGKIPDPENEGHSGAEIALLLRLTWQKIPTSCTNDINNADDDADAPTRLMADGIHPNDAGYALMANRWFVWYPQGEIANGAGLGPNGGTYNCIPVYVFLGPRISFIQAVSNVISGELGTSACACSFTEPNVQIQQLPTPTSGQFSDLNDNNLNGDGRVEYLWLDDDGGTTAFLNLGSTAGGIEAGQVQWLPSGVIATGVGARRNQVQFAVDAWLNLGGPDDGPDAAKVTWFPAGTIATGIGQDGAGIRFANLNGDGRAEYLWLDQNSAMTAYLNLGAPSGEQACAANVEWLPQGVVATGPANDNVILADLNGDGRVEYLTVTHDGGIVSLFINGGAPNDGPNAAQVVWYSQGVVATGIGTSGVGV
ncbi:hypothetical protein K438DRAFT_1977673 [Mycena galopus ATCC 62051]|nr:hypothetical protein K438DRAFT_1977673 [Mycena galopus ATCC 62051]